jgi:hypothetical protein
MSLSTIGILVSSVYRANLAFCTYPGKSFMYNRYCIGPNIEPWGIHKLFFCIRKSIYEGYYCYQFLRFQEIE